MIKIKNIGIIGGGKMGSSIFDFLSDFEFELVWINRSNAEKANKKYQRKLNRAFKNDLISDDTLRFKTNNHKITSNIDELANCDLVIEAITEDIEEKQKLLLNLLTIIKKECVIATNSSSILPYQLTNNKNTLQRLIGMHFFYPVSMKKIVEFISIPETSKTVFDNVETFLNQISLPFINLDVQSAFILNRFMLRLQASAFNYVQSTSITFEQLDSIVKQSFDTTGIFEMMDHIGLDLILTSARNYLSFINDKAHYEKLIHFLEKKTALNEVGIKTQKGFYNYPVTEGNQPIHTDNKNTIEFLANSFANAYNCVIKKNKITASALNYGLGQYLNSEIEVWLNQATK